MIDREKYDIYMEQERKRQMSMLADYLADNVEQLSNIRSKKITPKTNSKLLKKIEETPIPRDGKDAKEVGDEMIKDIFSTGMLIQHPRFFSFVASCVSPYSIAGSILSDIYNFNGGGWSLAPAACTVEEKLIKWMGSLAGYKDEKKIGGVFLSGGSISNLTALIAARDKILDENEFNIGVAYLSDQTHSSIRKGLKLIGLRKDQIVIIPTDNDFKMKTNLLEEHINKDIKKGLKPFVVIGSIATTNTGSIDPLEKIGDICQKYNLWFHIDGAFGASILLSDIYRNLAKGIEKSDSFSWDWHKWMLQVYSCSCIIVKDKNNLLNSFVEHPEYLSDVISNEHNDAWDLGPEMSRPHRALKLWYTIQAMGTDLMMDIIDYSFFNAKQARVQLSKYDYWEITSKESCATITFRYAPDFVQSEKLDELNSEISKKINSDGYAYIVTTTVLDKIVLRMCMINGNTTTQDVISTIDYINDIAKKISKKFK